MLVVYCEADRRCWPRSPTRPPPGIQRLSCCSIASHPGVPAAHRIQDRWETDRESPALPDWLARIVDRTIALLIARDIQRRSNWLTIFQIVYGVTIYQPSPKEPRTSPRSHR